MKLTNKDIVLQCMENITVLQGHIRSIEAAAAYLFNRRKASVDYGNLRDFLVDSELEEWRKLSMFGLTLNDADRDRVKAAVHDRFLRDGVHVADWFNGGAQVSAWFSEDEDAFREMARKAFAPSKA